MVGGDACTPPRSLRSTPTPLLAPLRSPSWSSGSLHLAWLPPLRSHSAARAAPLALMIGGDPAPRLAHSAPLALRCSRRSACSHGRRGRLHSPSLTPLHSHSAPRSAPLAFLVVG